MKVAGLVLAVLGGLMVLSSVNLALTKYDMSSSHDLSKFAGGLGVAVFVLLGGVLLMRKGKARN